MKMQITLYVAKYRMNRDARKPVLGVSNQAQHKSACTVTETG